ncbi:MAG: hypothetical protein M3Q93_05770 [Gemmatimonadota bacterium]|nr:hypothetical protein [Gemmatimonadota bacterium]
MNPIRRISGSLLLAAALTGCGSKTDQTSAEPQVDPNTPVLVEVENHYQGDVIIYLSQGAQRQRLGMVSALSSAEFSFPWRRLSLSGTSRLVAYPIAGSQTHSSDQLHVQPGQSISWTLEGDLDRSSLSVW